MRSFSQSLHSCVWFLTNFIGLFFLCKKKIILFYLHSIKMIMHPNYTISFPFKILKVKSCPFLGYALFSYFIPKTKNKLASSSSSILHLMVKQCTLTYKPSTYLILKRARKHFFFTVVLFSCLGLNSLPSERLLVDNWYRSLFHDNFINSITKMINDYI